MNALLTLSPQMRIGRAALRLVLVALLLGGLARPVQAQYDSFHTPVIDSILAAEDSMAAARVAPADTSGGDQHAILRGLNALDDVLPTRLFEVLLILSFVVIPIGCAGGFAAVALFSESGCLRILLAIMGWLAALLGGLIGGGLLGTLLGSGLSFFIWTGVIGGGMGYPIVFAYAQRRIKQLPREAYLTWKHTLAGGALVGVGAGSAASLARSAGALFKGGGGSFGGGGASGTFGGGQVAQVTTASAQGASVQGATILNPAAPSIATGAVATGKASTTADSAGTGASGEERAAPQDSWIKQWMQSALSFVRRLRWYHGAGFVLVGLVFLPVGMGITATLERPYMLLGIAVIFTMLRGSWLVTRWAPDVLGFLPVLALFLTLPAMGAVAGSQDPQWHLTITVAIAVIVEIGYYMLPNNLLETMPHPSQKSADRETPFRGGGASEHW